MATAIGMACYGLPSAEVSVAESPTASLFAEPSHSTRECVSLFDGKSLAGWKGLSENWSVEDGAITGVNTAENPIKNNTFLVCDKTFSDFELVLKSRFREEFWYSVSQQSIRRRKVHSGWLSGGYDASGRYMGINYEERGRQISPNEEIRCDRRQRQQEPR